MAWKLFNHWLRYLGRRLALLACAGSVAIAAAPGVAHAANLLGEPTASLFWSINASTIMTVFQNGECTELAADKRPDVLQAIVEGFIGSELGQGVGRGEIILSMPDLDARAWLADAQRVGLPTGHTPRAGALIVFQPGTLGAGSSGHIAYVQRVNRNGSFRIAQMHAPYLYQVTHRKLPARATRLGGVGFIY